MDQRYFTVEDFPALPDSYDLLLQCTQTILDQCPPILPWPAPLNGQVYRGLFAGPTSVAYFFLLLSARHPNLLLSSPSLGAKNPHGWCNSYLSLDQTSVHPLFDKSCGITNELLSHTAVLACATNDFDTAKKFLSTIQTIDDKTDPANNEWFSGRAGILYLLRMLRHHLPAHASTINAAISPLITYILSHQPWTSMGQESIGAAHGEIGIITQAVLSEPSCAPRFQAALERLLNLQDEEGNWPVRPGRDIGLIQFCHGAPGFVASLLAIHSYLPELKDEIDKAVEKGRKVTWEKGLLKKEPNICHGISGNAMVLEPRQRDQMLGYATPRQIEKGIEDGQWSKGADGFGLLWGEAGRAWCWMSVASGKDNGLVVYTDV